MEYKYVLSLNFGHALTPQDFSILYDLAFCRRSFSEKPTLNKIINTLAISTRTTIKSLDDKQEIINTFYKFNDVKLPEFSSKLLSVYSEQNNKKEYRKLSRYWLVGTDAVRSLSNPEMYYLLHNIEAYIQKKKPLGEIELLYN